MADGEPDLTPDAPAPRPGEARGAQVVVGILGESGNPDAVRIFLDLTFRKSYDVPRSAILRREALTAERSPLGVESSMVWIAPGTLLTLEYSEPRRVEEEFLAGDFTVPNTFVPIEAAGRLLPVRRTRPPICDSDICTELGPGCGTHHPAFPSCGWKCPTDIGTGCGSNIGCGSGFRCEWTVDPSCWGVCR